MIASGKLINPGEVIYELYEKICNEREAIKKEINASILKEIGNLFRKNDSYVSKWIVKGLYRKEEAKGENKEAIRNTIVKQVKPLNINEKTVDEYLNG